MRFGLLLLAALVAATPAAAEGGAWKLVLSANETWDTNVNLGSPAHSGFATRFNTRLSRNFQGPRSQLGLSGGASKRFLHGQSSARSNAILYSVGVNFGYQISESASLTVSESFKSSFTADIFDSVQASEDVLLPQSLQKRNSLHASLGWQVSALTTATVSGSYYTVLFQQDPSDQPRLTNGDRLGGGVGLSRKLSAESSVNLSYGFAKSNQRVTTGHTHSVSLGYARVLGEFTNAGLFIGASRREGTTTNVHTTVLTGGLAIARELEDSSVSLGYSRNLDPLFGLGRDVTHDTFHLSFQRNLARHMGMNAFGSYTRNRDPLDPSFSYDTWRVGVHPRFNLDLKHDLHFSVSYSFAMRDRLAREGTGGKFMSHRIGVQFGWNTSL